MKNDGKDGKDGKDRKGGKDGKEKNDDARRRIGGTMHGVRLGPFAAPRGAAKNPQDNCSVPPPALPDFPVFPAYFPA